MEQKRELLLLHGALGAASGFDLLAERLSRRFIIHRFDFTGHSKNESREGFSMDTLVAELLAYLQARAPKQWNVFGYSMGGYVALTASHQEPDLFSKVMTLATKFNWNPETALRESRLLNPEKMREKVPSFARQLEQIHGEKWEMLVRHTAQLMLDLGANPRLTTETLSQIKHPVSLHLGELDKMVSREETQWAANNLSNSQVTIIENTAHAWELVNTDLMADLIESFF